MTTETTEARVLAEAVCHDEQMTNWTGEVAGALSMGNFVRDDLSYDEVLDLHATIGQEIRRLVAAAFDHPEALTALRSSVSAGSVESIARILYECEKRRADHADKVMGLTRSTMEPWEECKDTFLSDAAAVLAALSPTGTGSEQDLIDALAGMLDSFGGYVTPECDAAIAAMQARGIDRWSAMARPVPTFDVPEDEAALSGEQNTREGWVSVPKEPTEAMQQAGASVVWEDFDDVGLECANAVYRAMIAAAPSTEQTGGK